MKKINWKKILIGTIIVLFVICVGLYAVFVWMLQDPYTADNYYPVLPDDNSLEAAEYNAQIKIPPSAHEIHTYYSGLNEVVTYIGFKMAPSDLEVFMNSTTCEGELEVIEAHKISFPEWWNPENATKLMSCNGEYQHVEIDMSDPDEYFVFISN